MVILQGNKYLISSEKVIYRLITNALDFYHSNDALYPVLNTVGSEAILPTTCSVSYQPGHCLLIQDQPPGHDPIAGRSQRCSGGRQHSFYQRSWGLIRWQHWCQQLLSTQPHAGTQGCPCCIRWTFTNSSPSDNLLPFLKSCFPIHIPHSTEGTAASFLPLH